MRRAIAPTPINKTASDTNSHPIYTGIISAISVSALSIAIFEPRTNNDWTKVVGLTAFMHAAKLLYAAYLLKYTTLTPSEKKYTPVFFAALTITTVVLLALSFDLSRIAPEIVSWELPAMLSLITSVSLLTMHFSQTPPTPNAIPAAAAHPS